MDLLGLRIPSDTSWNKQGVFRDLATVEWMGRHGMQLIPMALELARSRKTLHMLVLHLGENDLPYTSVVNLMEWILEDLQQMVEIYPASRLVCSVLLPWSMEESH